jgi:hypothetical protein
LEIAAPVSTIASLSAGEFVGMVANNPDQNVSLKTFYSTIINDHELLKNEKAAFMTLPVIRKVDQKEANAVYQIIKQDIRDIVEALMEEILSDQGKRHLLVSKK